MPPHRLPTLIAAALLLPAALLPAACEAIPVACGRIHPDGGPPVLDTREAESCDYARVLMHDFLNEVNDGTVGLRIVNASKRWDDLDTRDALRAELTDAVGADFAAAIDQVVAHTLTASRRPYRGAGPDHERDLVHAAVHGIRIALDESYVPDTGILGTDGDA